MKRFIDLKASEAGPNFAFYCTIVDKFEDFNGNQAWDDVEEFIFDFRAEPHKNLAISPLERYLSLIQAWVPRKDDSLITKILKAKKDP